MYTNLSDIRGIYNSVIENNLENFKEALHSINKPLNEIFINNIEKTTILHFLGNNICKKKLLKT
jgi:predicted sugar kinase